MHEIDSDMIPVWKIDRIDAGYIYIVEHARRLKIGKSKDKASRIRAARTWVPDMTVIGVKPFWHVTRSERQIHEGLSQFWYSGEWFDLGDDPYRDTFLDEFLEFRDNDSGRDRNTVDFIYWMHGGFMEIAMERHRRKQTLRTFQRDLSVTLKSV